MPLFEVSGAIKDQLRRGLAQACSRKRGRGAAAKSEASPKAFEALKGRTEEQKKRKRSQEVAVETLSDARSALKDVFESVEFRIG